MSQDPFIALCRTLAAAETAANDPTTTCVGMVNKLVNVVKEAERVDLPTSQIMLTILENTIKHVEANSAPERLSQGRVEAKQGVQAVWAVIETTTLLAGFDGPVQGLRDALRNLLQKIQAT